MNAPLIKVNAQEKAQKRFAADRSCARSPPDRTKPDAEGERRRRVIRIRPIVDRPTVVVGTVVRTRIAVMTRVAPDITVRAEIGGVRCAGTLCLRLWRCGGAINRTRPCNHKRTCDKGCPDQALHDGLLSLIQTVKYAQQSRQFQGSGKTKTGPQ